ncbi:DUF3080 domain-containing protein [Salinimonas marina]|uniref:DUF3080 domain-containing protein n=1 Tax=Salinimonas marina TaxID=2785918 RepID=A0A7S9DVA3_9ALTE|nr:DUF3080 family protein [Salinimonas marina]QPG04571.1 DUF3080 domain-containing protein [Salinimonas marina]
MRGWLLITVCTLLSGCFFDSGLDDELAEYQARLSRVLDTQAAEVPAPPQLDYPSAAELTRAIEPVSVNLRDFYQLQNCEIGSLVAQRNTVLGKTAQLSQRFVYESRLLDKLQQCITTIASSQPKLSQQLTRWLELKQHQQPDLWANLVQVSPEMRAAYSRSPNYIEATNNSDVSASVPALSFVASLQQRSLKDATELETQLKIIDSARLPARLWRTQTLLLAYLTPLNTHLSRHLPALSCPDGKASEQVKILKNVFYLFFIEKIQPVGSKLNQFHYQLAPVWETLTQDPALHPSFKRYLRFHTQTRFNQYQQTVRAHVQLWQDLFARCNLSPTAPISPGS